MQFVQVGEVPIVRCQPSREFPDSLDGRQLGAVRRQKQQFEMGSVLLQQRLEQLGVVVAGVVQHHHHPLVAGPVAKQFPQVGFERGRVELGRHDVNELAASQADRAEAGDGLARGGVVDHGVPVLRGNPHSAARAVLLEVAFVQAPQFNVAALRQPAQFF